MDDVTEQRRRLRAAGRLARSRITGSARADATRAVVAALLALPELAASRRVLLTAAVGEELDLLDLRTALHRRGAAVALPRVDGENLHAVDWDPDLPLQPGWREVPEPVGDPGPAPDVVVVPALVLDRRGGRLGYGGGHFDRYLAGAARGATSVGAAFHDQLVAQVPLLPHDVVLDVVVTERGVWRGVDGPG